jgi:integrase
MLRLRWRVAGQRYEMSLGLPDSRLNRFHAQKRAAEIELDIASNQFDPTLEKYRAQAPPDTPEATPTADLFAAFTETRRSAGARDYNLHNVYGSVHRYLSRFGPIASTDDAARFVAQLRQGKLKATSGKPPGDRTINKYLSMLRRFGAWCLANDHWPADYFRRIEPLRTERSRASRKAFSDNERRLIFAGFTAHPAYRYYLPYLRALFWLGWRPSEIIGLRWRDIDLDAQAITVGESLSRDIVGRTRKPTKGGTIRTLSLNAGQWAIITEQPRGPADALVFPSPTGRPIDDKNFCNRIWAHILDEAGIPYRPPYTARHTFATWAKRNGMTDEQLAYWLGHRTTRMVREHYGHLDESAKVPELPME